MILRGVVLLIAAAMLCGCQTERSGLDYATAMQRIGPPKAGHARIVVFREKGFGGVADAGWEFALDGAVLKGLKTGTYLYVDRPAGQHQFFAAEPGFPARRIKTSRFNPVEPISIWPETAIARTP